MTILNEGSNETVQYLLGLSEMREEGFHVGSVDLTGFIGTTIRPKASLIGQLPLLLEVGKLGFLIRMVVRIVVAPLFRCFPKLAFVNTLWQWGRDSGGANAKPSSRLILTISDGGDENLGDLDLIGSSHEDNRGLLEVEALVMDCESTAHEVLEPARRTLDMSFLSRTEIGCIANIVVWLFHWQVAVFWLDGAQAGPESQAERDHLLDAYLLSVDVGTEALPGSFDRRFRPSELAVDLTDCVVCMVLTRDIVQQCTEHRIPFECRWSETLAVDQPSHVDARGVCCILFQCTKAIRETLVGEDVARDQGFEDLGVHSE